MRANNEGTVYQRKDGRWVAAVSLLKDGKHKRVSHYAKTEAEARRKLTELKGRQDAHKPIDFGRQTTGAWLETWLDTFIRPIRKPRTWASYYQTVHTYVLPAIGHIPLADLPPESIQAILNYHTERGRQRTAAYIRTVLRAAFKRAVKLQKLSWNPVDGLDTVRVAPKETQIFTAEQAEVFLNATKNHRFEALFWIALTLGLRKGELAALSWTSVDWVNRELSICETLARAKLPGEETSRLLVGPPKSRASQRRLPLPDCALEALRRQAARQVEERALAGTAWQESGRVFTSTTGTPVDGDNLTKEFHGLCEVASVPKIRFHDLRHSVGTLLHSQGASPFTIQEILGHSQLVTTRRYTHADSVLQKTALGKIGNLLQKPAADSGSAVTAAVKPRLLRVK